MNYRHTPQLGWNFDELVVDNFAGGGGASTGMEMALGRPVDVAINHDPQAISMHMVNHPATRHYLDDVWQVDPRTVTQGRPLGLAWFSPDCTHHSKARGGKPVSPRVRGLAWIVLKWAGLVRPRVIMLENVEEFEDWGPLTRSKRPCPRRKGMIFEKFVSQLQDIGYRVEWNQLRACDYGAPTIRKRLFLVARCDGLSIVWPAPTHGAGKKRYRTAADIIDWSIPCPSIFARKKPLAEKTLARIAKGIRRFVIDNPRPFVVKNAALGDQLAWMNGGRGALVSAFLAKHYSGVVGHGVDQPLGTITTKDHHALVTSHLLKLRNNQFGQSVEEPMPTLTAGGGHVGEVRAFLLKYYGTNIGHDLREPLQTITSKHRFGLVMVRGQAYRIADIGMRMLKPHELFAAQGFPANYVIDRDAEGRRITVTDQVKKCGNSVAPPVVAALVSANIPQTAAMGRRA